MKKQSELFPTMTSSAEGCHVKVGQQPVNKKAQKMTATSGRQCLKLLKAKDPLMLLSKTLLVSSPWEGQTSYQMTWKPKATLRRRLFFQLYPSKLPTEGIESGSSGKKSKSNLWSTPTTFDHTNIKNPRKNHPGGGQKPPLQQQVNMWPTPTTRDYKGGRKFETLEKSGRNENNSLPDRVNAENKKTAALNPDWVEWLMGYAPGYSDIDCDKPMQLEDHLGFESEPDIPRVTTRKEHRVNRLKCLGNSIVPQIMFHIGNAILEDDRKK